MRLIDADALMEKLGMARECGICPNCKDNVYCKLSSEMVDVCEAIDEMPTIDTVKHGRWKIEREPRLGVRLIVCDCGFRFPAVFGFFYFKYCPSCGAMMDQGGDGDE